MEWKQKEKSRAMKHCLIALSIDVTYSISMREFASEAR